MSELFLLVGLGNPGSKYESTRHNIGFRCLDAIAHQNSVAWSNKKNLSALITSSVKLNGSIDSSFICCKPQTYMNLSGESVLSISTFYKVHAKNIIVIHDDIDLPFGELRYKFSGGNAGHNGLRSISAKIGPEFHRIRFGVGRPQEKNYEIAQFVLQKFLGSEEDLLPHLIEIISSNLNFLFEARIDELKLAFSQGIKNLNLQNI
ncbi:MAG TPA: aminoacyl-tRNA hydrolase [Candidatus Megaira endosymbiont of Nemacystus decipiens]|nr:aminoacyl-tRNA hydrolase [Candidatus Megaera endosymbiont of Nemacystus decipiens]